MKYAVLLAVLVCFSLAFAGCRDHKAQAEKQAHTFAQQLGLEVERIVCVNQDSDRDGYVSCTFKLKDGETTAFECVGDVWMSSKEGCREPKASVE